MATSTFEFLHSQNTKVRTRVVLTDGATNVVDYEIYIVRDDDTVTAFNNNTADSLAPILSNINILGTVVSLSEKYTFDWWFSTTQTVSRTINSSTLRSPASPLDPINPGLFRVGMVRQAGVGIPANAAINIIGSTTVGMTVVASSTGTNSVTFSRARPAAAKLIKSGTVTLAAGTTGSISGTNLARGTVGSATLSGSFTSFIDAPAWSTTSPLPGGTRGVAYSTAVSADRAASYSLVGGTLPSGLSLSGGTISGTPDTVQSSSFTIRATNSNRSVDRDFTININPPVPSFSTPSGALPVAIRGIGYSTTISATDTSSTGYSLIGSVPAGLTLNSNGTITGTATTLQTSSFTVRATNAAGSTDRNFSITVNPPAPVFTDQTVAQGAIRNIPYQDQVVATDAGYGVGTAYSVFSGSLPPGLTLNSSTGVIGRNTAPTQAPTTAGTYQFVIRATNVTGSTNTGNLIIIVANNLGKRRTSTGFENISAVRRFNGTTWVNSTLVKRFNGTAWVDVTNS